MKPLYHLNRWPYGWTISAPDHESGVPLTALNECIKAMPKNAVMDNGIAHHLKQTRHRRTVFVIVTASQSAKWRKEIETVISRESPEQRWWLGFDVGLSSAAIFAVLATFEQRRRTARDYSTGATPKDSDDLGRCLRLLALFPGWNERLHLVAEAYPQTAWPAIIARWHELEAATPAQQTALLRDIHKCQSSAA